VCVCVCVCVCARARACACACACRTGQAVGVAPWNSVLVVHGSHLGQAQVAILLPSLVRTGPCQILTCLSFVLVLSCNVRRYLYPTLTLVAAVQRHSLTPWTRTTVTAVTRSVVPQQGRQSARHPRQWCLSLWRGGADVQTFGVVDELRMARA
jgi:hypothetical protein